MNSMIKFNPIYFLLPLLAFGIFGCSDESNVSMERDDELILKKISLNYTFQDYIKAADFDSEGRITRVYLEDENNIQVTREYLYNEMGLIESFTDYLNFIYDDNGILIRRGVVNYYDYSYNGKFMAEQGYDSGGAYTHYKLYEFSDISHTKLVSIKSFDSSNNNELVGLTTFHYDGNNPIEITVENKFPDETDLELKYRYSLTYDNNKNPLAKGLAQNAYIAHNTLLFDLNSHRYNIAFKADNNLINILDENFDSNQTITISKSYSYNNQGYPLEAEVTINNSINHYEIYEYH